MVMSRSHLLGSLLAGVLAGVLTIAASTPLLAQGGSIYRQVISPDVPTGTGQPASGATVRICPINASGTPCSPLSTVYADPTLIVPLPNPFSADANGNYSVFLATGSYLLQETPVPGVTYAFLVFVNGTGTVSSVNLNLPASVFTMSGEPCTGVCNITGTFLSQTSNRVFANCTGISAVPSFCALTANMIPGTLNATVINGLTVNGTSALNGNTAVTGTFSSSGLSTLDSLAVTNASSLNGGVLAGTFTGNPTLSGNLLFSGNPSFTGSPVFSAGTPSFTNGGSLVGTFSGSPVFSGAPSFTGTPVFANGADLSGTFTGNPTFSGMPSFNNGGVLAGTFSGSPTLSGNPNFTGDPQAITQPVTDDDTSLATTKFVQDVLGAANGFSISKTTNGYIKLPSTLGGLILQWATGPSNAPGGETDFTVNFPIAFPTACLNVQLSSLTPTVIGNSGDMLYQVISFNATSTHIYLQEFSDGRDIATKVLIFAIGY